VAGQHQILDVEMTQQTQSDSQENPVLSCSQELNVVSGHYNDQEHHRNQGNPVHLVMLPTELCVSGNKFWEPSNVSGYFLLFLQLFAADCLGDMVSIGWVKHSSF
jgi:hypothetical protein